MATFINHFSNAQAFQTIAFKSIPKSFNCFPAILVALIAFYRNQSSYWLSVPGYRNTLAILDSRNQGGQSSFSVVNANFCFFHLVAKWLLDGHI